MGGDRAMLTKLRRSDARRPHPQPMCSFAAFPPAHHHHPPGCAYNSSCAISSVSAVAAVADEGGEAHVPAAVAAVPSAVGARLSVASSCSRSFTRRSSWSMRSSNCAPQAHSMNVRFSDPAQWTLQGRAQGRTISESFFFGWLLPLLLPLPLSDG